MQVKPDHEVAIIGGGTAGLGIGEALRRAGITDFVIFERTEGGAGSVRFALLLVAVDRCIGCDGVVDVSRFGPGLAASADGLDRANRYV